MIELTPGGLDEADVVTVAREWAPVELGAEAREAMAASAAVVEGLASSGEPVYGVSTGFGSLATVSIPAEARAQLQASLLRSHAAGMGPAVETEVVRAMMLLRARTLAMGYSGARPEVAEAILRPPERRPHAGRTRAWLARGQRRPRPARPLRPAADRGGRAGDPRRGAPARRRGARHGGHRAARAGREGGPGADQRHRRHPRDAGAGDWATCDDCCGSRTSPPRCRSRRCSAPTAPSPRTSWRCAPSRARR